MKKYVKDMQQIALITKLFKPTAASQIKLSKLGLDFTSP